MKKNIIKSAVAVIVATSLLASCKKDFLNKEAISQSSVGNFFKTANDAEAGLAGAYSQAFLNDQYWVWDYTTNGDARADNCYAGANNPDNVAIDYFTQNASNGNVTRDWQGLYQDIYTANLVIDYVPTIPAVDFAGTRQAQIVAEAKFIRAISYFNLVTTFGDVPLITSTIKFPAKPSRTPVAAVYAQIENDLLSAETVLPATQAIGRATQGAAQALLAKVYAQEGKYENCLAYCNKVISGGKYSLVPNYATLFDGTKNTSESIFEIQHSSTTGFQSYNVSLYLPADLGTYSFEKFNNPTTDLISLYKSQGDAVRLNAGVLFGTLDPGTGLVDGDPISPPYTATSPYIPFLYKWKTNISQWDGGTDNTILIRLADIILLKAEASNRLGNTSDAIPLVNKIRNRVGLPNITVTDKDDVALAILTERRMELAFEGERWRDLLRFGSAYTINLMNHQVDPSGALLKYGPGGTGVTENQLLFPVPISEIQLDNNMTQNPGY